MRVVFLFLALTAHAQYPEPHKPVAANPEWANKFDVENARPLPVIQECTPGTWALTFDDGPAVATPQVLDILKTHDTKATFFILGSNVQSNARFLQRAHEEGHQIALHSWSHPHLTNLTDDEIIAEMMWNMKAVRDVIGVTPRFMRPPYGEYNDRVVKVLAAMDIQVINWNLDTNDWKLAPDQTYDKNLVMDDARNLIENALAMKGIGYIQLQHDLFPEVVDAAKELIEIPIKSGRKMVTVAECAGQSQSQWYMEPAKPALVAQKPDPSSEDDKKLAATATDPVTTKPSPSSGLKSISLFNFTFLLVLVPFLFC